MPKRKTSRNDFGRGMSPAGFEPTAFRLGGGRSILLSYGDAQRRRKEGGLRVDSDSIRTDLFA